MVVEAGVLGVSGYCSYLFVTTQLVLVILQRFSS